MSKLVLDDFGTALSGQIGALRRYAMALTGDAAEADDLVQECLTRALERIRAYRQIRNLRAYLFSVLHNVRMDQLAKQRAFGTTVPLDEVASGLSRQPDQFARLKARDLAMALSHLPEQQRAVVLLVGMEGLSYREAAEALDVPVGTVMSRLSRGRESLDRLMAGEPVAALRRVK